MVKFEPFWEVRVLVSLAGLGAAPPPTREKAEVAAKATAMVAAALAQPPICDREVTAGLASLVRSAAFEFPSLAVAVLTLHLLYCRERSPLSEPASDSWCNDCTVDYDEPDSIKTRGHSIGESSHRRPVAMNIFHGTCTARSAGFHGTIVVVSR